MHQRGGCQWSGEPLRAPSRQGPVGEVVRQCGARERLVAGAPEGVIAACRQDLGVDLRLRQAAVDDQLCG